MNCLCWMLLDSCQEDTFTGCKSQDISLYLVLQAFTICKSQFIRGCADVIELCLDNNTLIHNSQHRSDLLQFVKPPIKDNNS